MQKKNQVFLCILIFLIPTVSFSCACYDENAIFAAFQIAPNAQCMKVTKKDTLGSIETRSKVTSISSSDNQIVSSSLVEQAGKFVNGYASSGECEMKSVNFVNNHANYIKPDLEYNDCTQILLDVCLRLNLHVIEVEKSTEN